MGVSLGISRKIMHRRLDEIYVFSGLGENFFEQVRTYSSGMKARLCFSVAVLVESDILLIDEMLSVGDVDFRERSLQTIERMVSGGASAIIVSHNLSLLQRLCSSVMIMKNGQVGEKIPVVEGEKFRKKVRAMS